MNLALSQTMSIPQRNHNTPFVECFKLTIMTSKEYMATLKHKQERGGSKKEREKKLP